MIYLAAPYSAASVEIRNFRYQRAKQALFALWDEGTPAICPIVLGHEYEQRQRSGTRSAPHEFWMSMAVTQLCACTHMYVLTLPGWDESKGVEDEVRLSVLMHKSIIGYQPFAECAEVSGIDIIKEFGLWKKTRT
jgi:hypothetical protein